MNSQIAAPSDICVVIPHLNQEQDLARCLASIWRGRRKPDQVIVVDNGSARLPQDICAAYPNMTLLRQPMKGPGHARNLGVLHSRCEVIAFIDADCIADDGWLSAAEKALRDTPKMILGGDVKIGAVRPDRLTAIEAYESVFAYRMDRYIAQSGFTGTGNLVLRQELFRQIGLFKGIDVAEDREWGQRATALGHEIRFVSDMIVFHPGRKSLSALRRKWDRHLAHDMAQCIGFADRLRWGAKALSMFASPLFALPRILVSDRLEHGRDRIGAFGVLVFIRVYRGLRMIQLLLGLKPYRLLRRWNLSDAH